MTTIIMVTLFFSIYRSSEMLFYSFPERTTRTPRAAKSVSKIFSRSGIDDQIAGNRKECVVPRVPDELNEYVISNIQNFVKRIYRNNPRYNRLERDPVPRSSFGNLADFTTPLPVV